MKFNATAIPNSVNASTLSWQLRTCAVCTELELAPKYSINLKVVECTATFRNLTNICYLHRYLLDLILAEVKIYLLNHSNFNVFHNKYLRFMKTFILHDNLVDQNCFCVNLLLPNLLL